MIHVRKAKPYHRLAAGDEREGAGSGRASALAPVRAGLEHLRSVDGVRRDFLKSGEGRDPA
jgi:hypothetical protein